ncbi:MAG: dihydroorotase [Candidatus Methanoperedens sp.]|nr:dihydroorotase [Candidatus Methanoperedens sp.]MCE8428201.1 dihydroorotase [Candidatus Methanoperedens sp.]
MPDLVIKNARLLINDTVQLAEIAIEDGRISKVGKIISFEEVNRVIDAKGALVIPGAIDIHVHFRDPGLTKKEDWYTGSCAAAAGGVTTVIDHPNTIPPTVDPDSFKKKRKEAKKKSIVDYGINAGVTANLKFLKDLWGLGAAGFGEIFMAESTGGLNVNYNILDDAFGIIEDLGAVACIHAEDEEIRKRLVYLLKGKLEPESHSKSRPPLSEKIAVDKVLKLAGYLKSSNNNMSQAQRNLKLHFCHISASESLDAIREAKQVNSITCEVTPHHLFLSIRDYKRLGTLAKMNPPLRDYQTQQNLWRGLNDGTIDVIASDHAPHLEPEKSTDIWSAPAGVPGVETLMPLMLMAVKRNLISLKRLLEVTSFNPARIFSLRKGVIAPGYEADIVIAGKVRKIQREKLHSKAGWTPYYGMEGIFPEMTISRGEIISEDNQIIAKRGHGRFIPGQGLKVEYEGA